MSDECTFFMYDLLFASDKALIRLREKLEYCIQKSVWVPLQWACMTILAVSRRIAIGLIWILMMMPWIYEPIVRRKNRQMVYNIASIKVAGVLREGRPFVAATTNPLPDREIEFLLDSGSSLCLIGRELYEQMRRADPSLRAEPADISLATHTNEEVGCAGKGNLDLNFANHGEAPDQVLQGIPFYVVNSTSTIPVIGSHLFKQYQTELQYTKDGILKMTLNDHPSEPGHVENRE